MVFLFMLYYLNVIFTSLWPNRLASAGNGMPSLAIHTEVVTHRVEQAVYLWGLLLRRMPGGEKTCLNTKLASAEIIVRRGGGPSRTLVTRHRVAFEILTDRSDHGVPLSGRLKYYKRQVELGAIEQLLQLVEFVTGTMFAEFAFGLVLPHAKSAKVGFDKSIKGAICLVLQFKRPLTLTRM